MHLSGSRLRRLLAMAAAALAVAWPRTLAQEPINIGDPHYDPLYPFGYGLTTHVGHGGWRHDGHRRGRRR